MSLQYYLRLPLVCLTLSVVGYFPELSVGDITENDPKINKLTLESFRSVNPAIQTPIRRTLKKRNVEQFNQYQLLTINPSVRSQRNYGNARNPSFSPTEAKVSASAIYYSSIPKMISSNVNRTNNPVELSRSNDGVDAKRSYAFQTVQREQNPSYFTGNQKRFSGINLAPWLKNKGLTNGVHASFGDQHLSKSKSEMYLDSSRPLGLNEPYSRETISAQPIIRPAQTERLPTNYMSGSSTVTYDTRYKSDGDVLFPQNNVQNQKALRKVVPISASLSILRANGQASKSLPRDSSAGGEVLSYENMRDVALSKVFKPPAVQTPVIKKSNSNGGQSILPSREAQIFSSQPGQVKQSNSERVASSNLQRSFVYGNTKLPMSSYALKDIQSSSTQNRGQSSENSMPIQMFPSQKKYYDLGTGFSVIRPSETSGARSYKGLFSNENGGIRSPTSALSNQSKQGTSLTQQMQFARNALFSEHDSRFKQPDTTTNSLTKPTRHNTQKKTDLNSSSRSAVQSLFTESYPVPGHIMKNVHGISPSVSNTQGMFSSQNRPYYLTSKKPFAFRSFTFVPTLQKSLHMQHAPAHPSNALSALAQKPMMPNSYEKTGFQAKDIETSQEKPADREQTDSFDNERQRKTVSSTEAASNAKSVSGQALVMQVIATNTSVSLGANNGSGSLKKNLQIGNDGLKLGPSKTSQRWISSRFTSAQTESNHGEIPTVRSSIARFVEPDTYSKSMISSNGHDNYASELVLPIYWPSLKNKETGYSQIGHTVIQPLHRYNLKEHAGLVNPTNEIKKDRNSVGVTQSNTSENYSATRLRPSSSFVTGRRVEATQEGKRSGENLNKTIYALPSLQSVIYRAADVNRYKTNGSSVMYRSADKDYSNILPPVWTSETLQASKMDIDLSAVGVSQGSRPTSSFVVGRYVNAFNKVSSKSNLNTTSTKTDLYYKPVQFSDIVGSASFIKPPSAGSKAQEEVDLGSIQNPSNSILLMEERLKELLFDTTTGSSLTSALQKETDEGRVDSSGPERKSFTEESPQPTVYFSEPQLDPTTPTAEGTDPFYEGTLTPNTTGLVTMSSE